MRGSVRKRGTSWEYTVDIGKDPITNKRIRKSKSGFRTKKECEAAMNKLIVEIEQGDYVQQKEILLKDYLQNWLKSVKPNIAGNTFAYYRRIAENEIIPVLGNMQVSKIKPLDIEKFIQEKRKKENINNTTLKHYFDTLKVSLNQALKWQLISSNPCLAVTPPKKEKKEMQVLNKNQLEILLDFLRESEFQTLYLVVMLAVTCGLRRGEILGLEWSHIDFENKIITVKNNYTKVDNKDMLTIPKTDKSIRKIAMLDLAIQELSKWQTQQKKNKLLLGEDYVSNNFVCTWEDGRPVRPDYVTQQFSRVIKRLELPSIRFHDLRHTHATMLLLQNVSPKVVSKRLGHSNISTTYDIYAHVLPEMEREAADKLNDLFASSAK